jgi:hypothetical protein
MDESRTSEPGPAEPLTTAQVSVEAQAPPESSPVCDSWQQTVQAVLALVMFLGALAMVHYYGPRAAQGVPPDDLQKQVHALTAQIEEFRQEQEMPALVLSRYRNSIGYIYGVYQVGLPNQRPALRARVSGTGFLVGDGLVATNRHVAEPWFGDSEAQALIHRGATATMENLVIFFPGSPTPVGLSPASVSKTSDLAILRAPNSDVLRSLPTLPLAKSLSSPGEHVTVNCRHGSQVSLQHLRPPRLSPQRHQRG